MSSTKYYLIDLSQENIASAKILWFLNSGCSRHMTGDTSMFIKFDRRKVVTLPMETISIIQLCLKGYSAALDALGCIIEHKTSKNLTLKGSII